MPREQRGTRQALEPLHVRCLAYIHLSTQLRGQPPSEADLQAYFGLPPQPVHEMILELEERGLVSRTPDQARSLRILVAPEDLPSFREDSQAACAPLLVGENGAVNGAVPTDGQFDEEPVTRRVLRPASAEPDAVRVELPVALDTAERIVTKMLHHSARHELDAPALALFVRCAVSVLEEQAADFGATVDQSAEATERVIDLATDTYVAICMGREGSVTDPEWDAYTFRHLVAYGTWPMRPRMDTG